MSSSGEAAELAAREAAVQHELLLRILDDEAAGKRLDLASYRAAFPGYESVVERTFAQLGARETTQCEGRERIGDYLLVRQLGRGGQGTVYLARDSRLGRFVALKVLHGGSEPLGGVRIERFRREAEAASRIDHPSICGVLESGESEGLFFIAMRYVPGESLALHIARAAAKEPRALAVDLPRHGSTPEEGPRSSRGRFDAVLSFFERCARALHVAHEAGIVHRDLKPGNLMVTPEGEPVVLDFGLARDLEDTSPQLTRSDEVFGTPAYMAPEQLRPAGRTIDRRADIYSLGVTLFECLTLRRPYESTGIVELVEAMETGDPPDPRRLEPSIPKDLAVVVRCAMNFAREHRYATALDLADDLARVRLLQPIHARPAGAVLRAWRWTQRNRLLVGTLFVVVASLSTALGLSLAANERAARDHQRALDEIAHRQEVHDFLRWVLSSPSPLLIGPDTPLRVVFRRATEEIERRFSDRPRTRGEILALLGETQISLGDTAPAVEMLREAIPLLRGSQADRRVLSTALVYLARGHEEGPAAAEAAYPLLREAHALAVEEFGPDAEESLLVLHECAASLAVQRKGEEARKLASEIVARGSRTSPLLRRRVQITLGNLAASEGRWDEALAAFEAAGAIEPAAGDERDAFERLDGLRRLCNARARLGDPGDALQTSLQVIEDMRKLLGERHEQVGLSLGFHGTLLRRLGKHSEAVAPYEEALAIFEEQGRGPQVVHAIALNNLAALYRFQRRPEDALRLSQEAAAMIEALGGEAVVALPAILDNLADTHADRGDFPAALEAQRKSLDLLRQIQGEASLETVCAFYRAARLFAACDRFDEASDHAEGGHQRCRSLPTAPRVRALRFANEVALTLLAKEQAEEAATIARASLALARDGEIQDAAELARLHSDLGACLRSAGDLGGAEVELVAARDLLAKLPQPPRDLDERLRQRIEEFTRSAGRALPDPEKE